MSDLRYENHKKSITKRNYITLLSYNIKDNTLSIFIVYNQFYTNYLIKIIFTIFDEIDYTLNLI